MFNKRLPLLLIFVLLVVMVHAQFTQNIRGKIIDHETKTGLPGANIAVFYSQTSIGTIGDENGYFELFDIPIGKVDIQVSYMGYQPFELKNLQLISGKEKILTIELLEMVIKVEEIMVTALKNGETHNKMTNLSVRPFSIKETERYAGSLGDPSRMAANFAGVVTANDERNDLIIRGNSPQGLLWRLEGINIPNPNHFGALGSTGGAVSILNNNVLTNSDFFTGAFPAEYGNALSGVFDLKMRNGNTQKHEFLGQIGFNGFELGAEGPIHKKTGSSYLVNYRYSFLDFMDQMGFDIANGAVPEYQDLTVKIHLPTKKFGIFKLIGMGGDSFIEFNDAASDDDLSLLTASEQTKNGSSMFVTGITHQYYPDEHTNIFSSVAITQQTVKTEIDSIFQIEPDKRFFGEENRETKYSFATQYTKKITTRNILKTGLRFESYRINYHDSVDGLSYDENLANLYIYQLNTDESGLNIWQGFAEWKYRFNNYWTFYGGLHLQQFMLNGSSSFDPRINLSYHLPNNTELSFAYGKHAQVQPFYIYFTETYQASNNRYTLSNKDLDLSKAHHFVLAYNYRIFTNLQLKTEGYFQYVTNIPVSKEIPYYSLVNAGNSYYQERIESLVNEGIARNYGLELTLEKYLENHYYYLITTSLFDSKYQGYDQIWRNTEFNTNFIINALGGYEHEFNNKLSMDINLRVVWSGGKRALKIDLEQSILAASTVYDYEHIYADRAKDYFRLDGRASLILNGKSISQEWAIDFLNITDRKNIYTSTYDNNSQSIRYIYQRPFFPMFLYRINF